MLPNPPHQTLPTSFQPSILLPLHPPHFTPPLPKPPTLSLTPIPPTTLTQENHLLALLITTTPPTPPPPSQISTINLTTQLLESNNPTPLDFPNNLYLLDGEWKLIYTSTNNSPSSTTNNIVSGFVRGLRGIGEILIPGSVSAILQRFKTEDRLFYNVISGHVRVLPPGLSFGVIGRDGVVEGEVIIGGRFLVGGKDLLKVELREVGVEVREPFSGVMRTLPKVPVGWGGGGGEEGRGMVRVTYLGERVRITRDGEGEVRVFCRGD